MPLACDEHDITRIGRSNGVQNGLATIRAGQHLRPALPRFSIRTTLDLFDDPIGIFSAGVVGCDHDDVAEARGNHAHERPLRLVAVAAGAEYGDQPPAGNRTRRLEQVAQRIVGMGVVDHHRHIVSRARGDLEPTGNTCEPFESLLDRMARELGLESDITATGVIFGTPHYMSPEQGHGKPLDERSDLYSLGVVLYELLTAEKPYVAETAMGVIYCHANSPIPRLPVWLAHLQPLLDALLAKDPVDRPPEASVIVEMIDELLADAVA